MFKNRGFGIASIIVGIIVNNFAYWWDVIRNANEGFIYMGPKGILVAVIGVALILWGMAVLARSGSGAAPAAGSAG